MLRQDWFPRHQPLHQAIPSLALRHFQAGPHDVKLLFFEKTHRLARGSRGLYSMIAATQDRAHRIQDRLIRVHKQEDACFPPEGPQSLLSSDLQAWFALGGATRW